MAKKVKKVYKPRLKLAPKASLNRKWTVWRQAEMKNRQAGALAEMKKLALLSLLKDRQLVMGANTDNDSYLRYQMVGEERHFTHEYGERRRKKDVGPALAPYDRHRADLRMRLHYRIWELDKRAATPRMKNYCHYIGRSRSVNQKLFMSRHMFRKFARFGMLPGFVKERC